MREIFPQVSRAPEYIKFDSIVVWFDGETMVADMMYRGSVVRQFSDVVPENGEFTLSNVEGYQLAALHEVK